MIKQTPPAPAAIVTNADAVVAIFGQFDLHDAELRSVHAGHAPNGTATLDAVFAVPGELALATGSANRGAEYRVTLRCSDVSDLTLADFLEQNVVAEYAFETEDPAATDGRTVHVVITCSPGCDLELRCRTIAVTGIEAIG
jgi:hypothetical protein